MANQTDQLSNRSIIDLLEPQTTRLAVLWLDLQMDAMAVSVRVSLFHLKVCSWVCWSFLDYCWHVDDLSSSSSSVVSSGLVLAAVLVDD